MNTEKLTLLLGQVKDGKVSIEEALHTLRHLPFESLDYAHLDHHRQLRCGLPEVIYCPGKTTAQIVEIFDRLAQRGHNVLATRTDRETYEQVAQHYPEARFEELDMQLADTQERHAQL
ncbi:MAG TPA: hypothetical protein PLQ45_07255, partial [Anaerohalosphaeraceae bacterium]|nr:hypothetical protein [Anaerohalosphaeraceae bacterium]